MKKWYFSDNGQVLGPFNINDAIKLLAQKNDVYGWNPSFSQWLPVNQIPELSGLTSEVKPVTQISKELIDNFVSKKRDLNKKVKLIDEMIRQSKSNLNAFEQIIIKYNNLTESLSSEVKANILPIEKKKNLISKQLLELTRAANIAKHEIIDVVKEFGDLVLSKTSTGTDSFSVLGELPDLILTEEKDNKESLGDGVGFKIDERHSPLEQSNINSLEPKSHSQSLPEKAALLKEQQMLNTSKENPEIKLTTTPTADSKVSENNALDGVKSRLKSVFTIKPEEPSLTISEQLKKGSFQEADEVVFIDAEVNNALLDEAEQKKKRRRRRRF